MILESVEHGPLIWPTIEENGVTRTNKYEELSATEKIQADCDLKATNIILQGLPLDVYSLVNHHRVAKDLWERVQLLMQEQFEVNTKFLNGLPPEWSKFVTDVKLVRDLHTTNFDQLHAYLEQDELHANEVRIMRERNQDPLALAANHQMTPSHINTYQSSYNNSQFQQQFSPSQSPQYGSSHPTQHHSTAYPSTPRAITYPSTSHPNSYSSTIDSGLAVLVFKQGDDPIDAINKMMSFLSTIATSHFPTTNNQERQSSFAIGTSRTRANISGTGGNNSGQQRPVKCFNCQGEGHMTRQCPKPKRKRDATWFRDKVLLVEAQGSGKVLNEEELEFLADPGVAEAKAILMANFSSYRSGVLSEKVKELDNIVCKMGQSAQTVHMLMKPQVFYDNNMIQALGFQNPFYLKKAQQIGPMLYDGSVIAKETNVISIADSEETLLLEEESQSKMLLKQSDPMVLEKKVNIKPINYAELNRLSKDYGKRFVPQQELSDEQAFRLQTSHPNTDQSASLPVKIEAPRELLKVSLVNTSLKKLKYHLGKFDNVIKKQITPDALTEGEWGFEHTKVIEAVVQQYHVDKQCFEIQKKQFLIENDRLLDQIISQDIVNIVVNSLMDINTSVNVNFSVAMNNSVNYVENCNKCLELEAKLIKQHNMVEKDEYDRLSKSFSKLEQHCISLELAMQLNKEILQKNNTSVNQTKPSFDQLFELDNLKAELQTKDTTIKKLKANIKRLNKTSTTNSVKKDIDEIETINIELEHEVAKLIVENKHLKQTYKQLYDLIKPSRVHAKEHAESLVNQLNQKKFKGKNIVNNAAQASNATTIAPGMHNLDPVTLAPKDKNNRETHIYYLKHTMEQAGILREIVEQAKSLNPLDSASYSACKYVKLIQELLGYVRDTCPDIYKPSEKLVVVTPINKKKSVRFAEPVIPSSTSQKQLGSTQTKTKQTTNNSVSTSVGVIRSTKSSRSKSTNNTKNDRILQISSSMQKKNKVEVHSMIVNSMFDARHELCFLEFVSDMNARRTFTLVGNTCPLTRITTTNKVPLREPIPLKVVAQEYVVTKVYTRRPKVPKTNGSNSKPKIAKSVISNNTEPNTSRGSNTSVAPSSSSVDLRLSKLFCACAMGKSKKQSHKPKSEDTNQEKLYLLHIDLCGPMRVASINGKKYILVIVDDYSRFTWVKFLASKDEAPDFIIKFLKMIQVRLNTHVRNIHTDNGTEFIYQTLRSYYESVGISHETSVARSPHKNGVVERQNRTLVEAA
ncbi:reverse transcriptase domain-containing protein [Tanacetum coccineum]|uniref:Reverse transcriptase domain-containing protein n=1 Tax=Tanacetum coccineum TaxID=301880 RepID=A0ABQ5FU49_9ASTR